MSAASEDINLIFLVYHGLEKEEGTSAQQFARMLNIEKATVIKISGFKTEQYEINNKPDETPIVQEEL